MLDTIILLGINLFCCLFGYWFGRSSGIVIGMSKATKQFREEIDRLINKNKGINHDNQYITKQ